MTEATENTAPTTDAPKVTLGPVTEDTVEVDDLDEFVMLLTGWHTSRVDTVKHLVEIPEGTTFEIGDKSIVLEGATRAGFKFGLEMALMQLGKLPFVAEIEDETAEGEGVAA